MNFSQLASRAHGRYQRSAAKFFFRRPFEFTSQVPIVSFTFDDFPRSALHTGGAILKHYGGTGTYYASFGLMGKDGPTGKIFLPEDIRNLMEHGHELGCHTFAHCDSWETKTKEFERSVLENGREFSTLIPGGSFRTLSYPISPPRPETKQAMAKYFSCCRGGGQTFNVGTTDLNYLSAYFIEQSKHAPELLKQIIDQNREARGWLIFATHDVSRVPTPFGCTPQLFENIVQYAARSGARILPVVQAWEALSSSP